MLAKSFSIVRILSKREAKIKKSPFERAFFILFDDQGYSKKTLIFSNSGTDVAERVCEGVVHGCKNGLSYLILCVFLIVYILILDERYCLWNI